ncbi:MAG: tetratricopeptide repeat protein [Treponema sp.]|jgi:tetratricopeptide (TPR) repeat protein|nr:tetratricopeptide repeat protein [Treponema sp.]
MDESENPGENIEIRSFEKLQEGIDLYREKNWDMALKNFLSKTSEVLDEEEEMELTYYLGLCYTKLERYDEALNYLEQVVTTGVDILRVYQCRMMLAYIYVITKRIKMAEFELRKLQSIGLESPLLFNTLAYASWCQKKNKNAIDFYEKTLEIDMNNATAMNSMGYILADSGLDIMRGLRLCRRAVDSRPQSAAYLDSLGWAYYKSGEVVEARTWLRRALEIAPKEEEIIRHFKIVTGEPL